MNILHSVKGILVYAGKLIIIRVLSPILYLLMMPAFLLDDTYTQWYQILLGIILLLFYLGLMYFMVEKITKTTIKRNENLILMKIFNDSGLATRVYIVIVIIDLILLYLSGVNSKIAPMSNLSANDIIAYIIFFSWSVELLPAYVIALVNSRRGTKGMDF